MFNDAAGFKRIFLKVGYTDLRKGIPSLTVMIWESFGCALMKKCPFLILRPQDCRTDRIKGLVWENDGYPLLYKRLEVGKFQWPRTESEVRSITS